jgi:thymidine phosphorylase
LEVLKGRGPADLVDVSIELAARMLVLGKVADDLADADRRAREAIRTGAALERFRQIVEAQSGDPRVVDDYSRLPQAPRRNVVEAERRGYVTRLDAELIGRASNALGAGRDRVEDPVDPAVGISIRATVRDAVSPGDPLLELHYRDRARLQTALALASQAIAIGDDRPPRTPLIVGEVR